MIQVRSAFHYIWDFWYHLRNRLTNQEEDGFEIKAVLMKYKKFLEIFPKNAEIRQDFEVLEIFLEDHLSSSNNPKYSHSDSLPMLRLICQDDGLPITVIQIIQNLLNYRSIRKKRALVNVIYNSIDVIMKFSEFLKDFIVKDLPEIEILIDDVEPLIQEADILLCELCKSCNFAFRKLFSTLSIIEKEFPINEEYESRLLLPSFPTCDTEENNSTIAVLSEQTIICGLRCSFSLITSLIAVKFDKTLNDKITLLETQGEDLISTLNSLLVKSYNSSDIFKQRVEDILNIRIQKKTMAVKGLMIPREIRFTTEVNLYENTADMLNKGSEIVHLLENIRVCSVNIIKNKSDKLLVPYKDIIKSDNNCTSSSSGNKVKKENNLSDTESTLQNLQIELERQLKSLVTLMKLENQIINKVTHMNDKNQNKSFLQCTTKDDKTTEEPNLNDSVENVDSHSQNEQCPTSYESSTKEEGQQQQQQHHEYLLNHQTLDELFELVPGSEVPNDEHDNEISFDDRSNDGVEEARQVVLEQLKTVLKPRHDIMKSREEEAYKRAYGDRKVPLDDDIEIKENILEKKRKARQALLDELRIAQDDADHSCSDGEMCEIDYGDNDDDNDVDNNKVNNENESLFSSSDFKSRLDKILKSGAGSSYS